LFKGLSQTVNDYCEHMNNDNEGTIPVPREYARVEIIKIIVEDRLFLYEVVYNDYIGFYNFTSDLKLKFRYDKRNGSSIRDNQFDGYQDYIDELIIPEDVEDHDVFRIISFPNLRKLINLSDTYIIYHRGKIEHLEVKDFYLSQNETPRYPSLKSLSVRNLYYRDHYYENDNLLEKKCPNLEYLKVGSSNEIFVVPPSLRTFIYTDGLKTKCKFLSRSFAKLENLVVDINVFKNISKLMTGMAYSTLNPKNIKVIIPDVNHYLVRHNISPYSQKFASQATTYEDFDELYESLY